MVTCANDARILRGIVFQERAREAAVQAQTFEAKARNGIESRGSRERRWRLRHDIFMMYLEVLWKGAFEKRHLILHSWK